MSDGDRRRGLLEVVLSAVLAAGVACLLFTNAERLLAELGWVALFWAPIYVLLITVGTALRDATIEGRKDGETLPDWDERRARYGEFLGLQATTMASFRAGVAILTPLASALLGLLFKT